MLFKYHNRTGIDGTYVDHWLEIYAVFIRRFSLKAWAILSRNESRDCLGEFPIRHANDSGKVIQPLVK